MPAIAQTCRQPVNNEEPRYHHSRGINHCTRTVLTPEEQHRWARLRPARLMVWVLLSYKLSLFNRLTYFLFFLGCLQKKKNTPPPPPRSSSPASFLVPKDRETNFSLQTIVVQTTEQRGRPTASCARVSFSATEKGETTGGVESHWVGPG